MTDQAPSYEDLLPRDEDIRQDVEEIEKAKKLTIAVEAELIVMVEKVSREVGVDRKWILSEIVYLATQRVRELKDPAS